MNRAGFLLKSSQHTCSESIWLVRTQLHSVELVEPPPRAASDAAAVSRFTILAEPCLLISMVDTGYSRVRI